MKKHYVLLVLVFCFILPLSLEAKERGKIVFTQHYKGFFQIFIADLDSSNIKRLTSSQIDKRYPEISPDGKKIAYVTNKGEIWIMNIDGKNNQEIHLKILSSEPKWSNDNKKLVFASFTDLFHSNTKIYLLDLETLKVKQLVNRPYLQYSPDISPDETEAIFVDGPELFAQEIRRINLLNGDIVQVTDNLYYDLDPRYLSNGQSIIYSSDQSGNYDIWLSDKFGQDPKNLTQHPSNDIKPQGSQDQKRIYFLSDRAGNYQIWSMDMEAKNLKQITKSKQDILDFSVFTP